jgi:hypothetical protein
LRSAITHPGATGTTAQPTKASVRVRIGARMKTVLLAPAGITISLKTNLKNQKKELRNQKKKSLMIWIQKCHH